MEESIAQPNALNLTGNVAENWRYFKQEFELYLVAAGLDTKPDKQKVALLLHVAKKPAIDVYNTFMFAGAEDTTYASFLHKFDAYCNPKTNETYERYIFYMRNQQQGETVEQFVTDLKLKAKTCAFGDMSDSMIRDRIVLGIASQRVRERLLREDNLNLANAVKICQAAEATQRQITTLGNDALDTHNSSVHYCKTKGRGQYKPRKQPNEGQRAATTHDKQKCGNCVTTHPPRKCGAYNKACNNCGKLGHFSKVCRSPKISKGKIRYVSQNVHEASDSTSECDVYIGMVKSSDNDKTGLKWSEDLCVNDKLLNFKLDTGSDINVIYREDYMLLQPRPKLRKSNTVMKAYNDKIIPSIGVCRVNVRYKNRTIQTTMEVVPEQGPSFLGSIDCERLGLVKRVNTVGQAQQTLKAEIHQKYPELFKGNGSLPGTHSFVLKDGSTGVIHAPRRVAFAKRPKLKDELDRQMKLGYLAKVNEPTDWVNSMVMTEKKNGDVRICIDPKDLNMAIKREHFQIPTKEEILGELAGAKYFSKMDATAGFHQIELDEKSSMMTTFNTPFGRYRYLRLPMGICSAPEVFHKTVYQCLEDLDGVCVYIDDIIVWGSTIEQHDERLEKAVKKLVQIGLRLNKEKCYFRQPELPYLGEVVTAQGVKPDPAKVQAIEDMPTPKDQSDLQRILGLVTYMSRFIPNMSNRTSVLRSLLESGCPSMRKHGRESNTSCPVIQCYSTTKNSTE